MSIKLRRLHRRPLGEQVLRELELHRLLALGPLAVPLGQLVVLLVELRLDLDP